MPITTIRMDQFPNKATPVAADLLYAADSASTPAFNEANVTIGSLPISTTQISGILSPANGGTGVNNGTNTFTLLQGNTQIIDNETQNNLYIGASAGSTDTLPVRNTAFGYQAGQSLGGTGSKSCTFIGYQAGKLSTGTSGNTALGAFSGSSWITSLNETAIGLKALTAANGTNSNVAVGSTALTGLASGNSNTAVGAQSGAALTGGSNNVLIGFDAGTALNASITTLNQCTYIGSNALSTTNSLTNAIGIGYNVNNSTSNTAVIGQSLTSISTGSVGTQLGLPAVPFTGIALGAAANAGAIKQVTSVTLTAANIQAMYGTPVQLIAGIASNAIILQNVTLNFVYGGTNQFANGGVIVIQYGNTIHGAGTSATSGANSGAAGLITGTTNNFEVQQGYNAAASGTGTASSGIIGTGIYISNQSAAFTSGTNNTVIVTLEYLVFPMS